MAANRVITLWALLADSHEAPQEAQTCRMPIRKPMSGRQIAHYPTQGTATGLSFVLGSFDLLAVLAPRLNQLGRQ